MNVPGWRLDWIAERVTHRVGDRRVSKTLARYSRKSLRRLHDVYLVALFGRRRRLKKAIQRAGEFGQVVADMGLEHRRLS